MHRTTHVHVHVHILQPLLFYSDVERRGQEKPFPIRVPSPTSPTSPTTTTDADTAVTGTGTAAQFAKSGSEQNNNTEEKSAGVDSVGAEEPTTLEGFTVTSPTQ